MDKKALFRGKYYCIKFFLGISGIVFLNVKKGSNFFSFFFYKIIQCKKNIGGP